LCGSALEPDEITRLQQELKGVRILIAAIMESIGVDEMRISKEAIKKATGREMLIVRQESMNDPGDTAILLRTE
jgi:hypothetical protein